MAKVLREGGKTEEATGYLEHALEAASRQGAACTAAVEVVAQAKKVMAWLLDDEEQYAESAPLHAEVLRWQLSVLGEKHRETLLSKMNIGLGLAARSFFTEACMPLEEALLGNSQVLGSTHLHTLASATNLAYVYGQLERFRDAEALHKETLLPGLVAKFGADHPRTQAARQSLSQVLEMQDQFEEAEGIRREILQREALMKSGSSPPNRDGETCANQLEMQVVEGSLSFLQRDAMFRGSFMCAHCSSESAICLTMFPR